MLSGKNVLWSFAAAVPLLGLAWYGISAECCWPECCTAKASQPAEVQPAAKVAADCCPEGSCCPECCRGCCEEGARAPAVQVKAKVSSGDGCCSAPTPTAQKASAAKAGDKFCPPCPFCP
jgi:hypothetical protein